jgi:hypothetical protein
MRKTLFVLSVVAFVGAASASSYVEMGMAGAAEGFPIYYDSKDRAVLWENPFDHGLMTNAYLAFGHYHVQDDFILDGMPGTVQGFEWWSLYMGTHPVDMDIHIYSDSGGHPNTGDELWTATYLAVEEDTGYDIWGVNIWHSWIDLDPADYFEAEADTVYWLEIHCVTSNTFGWATESGGNLHENGSQYDDSVFLVVNGTSDDVDPTVTNTYPHDADYPSGVPVGTLVGYHIQDDASGADPASAFSLKGPDGDLVTGILDYDDSDPLNVIFEFEPNDNLIEGETYTVTVEAYDLAGNGPVEETWDFTTGFTNITPASLGAIKAGFTK